MIDIDSNSLIRSLSGSVDANNPSVQENEYQQKPTTSPLGSKKSTNNTIPRVIK